MIPKTIHYIWLGGNPLPPLAEKCIESWKRFCPDYEIKKWDETNFDVSSNQYCKEAYEAKKFAFASDYVRLHVLVNYGGVYMDTDVELIKPIDSYLVHQAFSGFESEKSIPTGIMACEKGFALFNDLLSDYNGRSFILPGGKQNTTTNVHFITESCLKKGLILNNTFQTVDGFALYPYDIFCPKNFDTGKYNVTENTVAVHHFAGSWVPEHKHKAVQERWNFYEKYGDDKYLIDLYQELKTLRNKNVDTISLKKLCKILIKRILIKFTKKPNAK
jgi:hypothetical protein